MEPSSPPTWAAGWYPDPQGRFSSRYFDGQSWTPTVRDRDGWTGPEWQAPASEDLPPGVARGPGVGLGVVLAGLVLVALSLSVLDWAPGGTFLDVREGLTQAGRDVTSTLVWLYVLFLGWLVAVLVGVWAVLRTAGRPPWTRTYLPAVGGLVAAVLHTVVMVDIAHEELGSVELGAWLGLGGYLMLVAGCVLGPRRFNLY